MIKFTPIDGFGPRPLWSVMMPTYNCARYLGQALESVLAQDPGPDQMEIAVVDDVSTQDDPGGVVRDAGRGRVSFHRNAANLGATRNFNACIGQSRGHLIHLLHGDDFVLEGFYSRMAAIAQEHRNEAMFCCRAQIVDAAGQPQSVTKTQPHLVRGRAIASELCYRNALRTPGVVVRRSFYESHGGFREDLVHAADWEMWVRAAFRGGARMIDEALCAYRDFDANDSARLARAGDDTRDFLRLGQIWAEEGLPGFDPKAFRRAVMAAASERLRRLAAAGDPDALENNRRAWRELATPAERLAFGARRLARHALGS